MSSESSSNTPASLKDRGLGPDDPYYDPSVVLEIEQRQYKQWEQQGKIGLPPHTPTLNYDRASKEILDRFTQGHTIIPPDYRG